MEQLQERVTTFAVSCAEKLTKQKSCCNTMMVFVNTNPHRQDLQYSRNIVVKLPFPNKLKYRACEIRCSSIGAKFSEKGYSYKKAGVIVMDFSQENKTQLKIFENSNPKACSFNAKHR